MRQSTIYRTNNQTGEVDRIVVDRRNYKPSYESTISKPFHQRVLDSYYQSECEQKLRPTDIIRSKSYVKRVHEQALAEGR